MTSVIAKFQYEDGSHCPLSNFYPSPFTVAGLEWKTVEHFYQAMKTVDGTARVEISELATPGQSKRAGRKLSLRADWEEVKLAVMRDGLERKFDRTDSPLGKYLLDTRDALLVEGNTWHDYFWGVCNGRGENWLGHLLMARRAELRALL